MCTAAELASLTSCANCLKCTARSDGPAGTTVTISAAGCKAGADISWMCARAAASSLGDVLAASRVADSCASADGKPSLYATDGTTKCDHLVSMAYAVPAAAATLTVQVHDGQFIGAKDCGGPGHPGCCGGNGNMCQMAVCEVEVDIRCVQVQGRGRAWSCGGASPLSRPGCC